MPALRDYHILISHSWDYDDHYQTICGWFDNASNFKWTNYSVPLTKPLDVASKRELKQKLRNRISLCSCVVILSGMYVAYSEWIDYVKMRTLFQKAEESILLPPPCSVVYLHKERITQKQSKEAQNLLFHCRFVPERSERKVS